MSPKSAALSNGVSAWLGTGKSYGVSAAGGVREIVDSNSWRKDCGTSVKTEGRTQPKLLE